MALSTSALLTQIETAITTVLEAGQEAEIQGQKYKRADLAVLRNWRDEVKAQLSQETVGSARNFAEFHSYGD